MLSVRRSLVRRRRTLAVLALALPVAAFAQGALTPPGAPAPTMKSLGELDATLAAINARTEKRTAVSATTTPGDATATFIVAQPGSYYLAGNLTGETGKTGILISAPNVTLDLNGFTLIAGATPQPAIATSGSISQVVVRNGIISGPWGIGIRLTASNSAILDVRTNGTTDEGVRVLGSGGIIERCQVFTAGGHGIAAATDQSVVRDCTVNGVTRSTASTLFGIIGATISDCTVTGVTNTDTGGAGTVYGIFGSTVSRCRVANVSGATGTAFLISAGVVEHCAVTNSGVSAGAQLYGISAREVSHCHVNHLTGLNTTPQVIGIAAPVVSDSIVERLQTSGGTNLFGIRAGTTSTGAGGGAEAGLVTRCVVSGCADTGIAAVGSCVVEGNRISYCVNTAVQIGNGVVRGNYTHNNGLGVSLTNGLATGNTSFLDTTAFVFGAGVRAGPTLVGGAVGAFDPNANFDL